MPRCWTVIGVPRFKDRQHEAHQTARGDALHRPAMSNLASQYLGDVVAVLDNRFSSHKLSLTMNRDERQRLDYALGRRKRPRTLRCRWCNSKIEIESRGRVPEFCSQSCRQRAYEQRKWARPAAVELVARDLATAKVREAIRAEAWNLLRQIGVVSAPQPPPAPTRSPKPTLRLVKPEPAENT
jgi:hypothetical protein